MIGIPRSSKAESTYQESYQERQNDDPEELGQEQEWEQEQESKTHHGYSLFLYVFFERYDVSFHRLQQVDISLYSIYDMSPCWLQNEKILDELAGAYFTVPFGHITIRELYGSVNHTLL